MISCIPLWEGERAAGGELVVSGFISPKNLCWNSTSCLWFTHKRSVGSGLSKKGKKLHRAHLERSLLKAAGWPSCMDGVPTLLTPHRCGIHAAVLGSDGSEHTKGPHSALQQCHCLSTSPTQSHSLIYVSCCMACGSVLCGSYWPFKT